MFKRIVGARNISIEDIPTYMDEFDELEAYYFSKERDPNQLKDAKHRGLYEYTVLTVVPPAPSVHVPYRQVAELAANAPEGATVEFVTKRLIANGAVMETSSQLVTRVEWAAKWRRTSSSERLSRPVCRRSRHLHLAGTRTLSLRSGRSPQQSPRAMTSDEAQAAAFAAIKGSGAEPGNSSPPSTESSWGRKGVHALDHMLLMLDLRQSL